MGIELKVVHPVASETYRIGFDDGCIVVSAGEQEDAPKVWLSPSMVVYLRYEAYTKLLKERGETIIFYYRAIPNEISPPPADADVCLTSARVSVAKQAEELSKIEKSPDFYDWVPSMRLLRRGLDRMGEARLLEKRRRVMSEQLDAVTTQMDSLWLKLSAEERAILEKERHEGAVA